MINPGRNHESKRGFPQARQRLAWRTLLAGALIAGCLAAGATTRGQPPSFTSSVDHHNLTVGDTLVFTLHLSGASAPIPQPSLPHFDGFKSVGRYQTVGHTSWGSVYNYHYLLMPQRAGQLVVPDFTLRLGDKSFIIQGFTIHVGLPAHRLTPSQVMRKKPAAVESPPEVILSAAVSTNRAYVGQPVNYALHLYTLVSVRNFEVVQPPDFQGFRKVEAPAPSHVDTRRVMRHGREYLDAVILRYTLFPIQAGPLQVAPYVTVLRIDAPGAPKGYRDIRLKGGAVTIHARQLPPSPPGFTGAVGDFRLSYYKAPPSKIEIGEPLSVEYRIEGTGFLPERSLQWEQTPFFSLYPATRQDDNTFVGSRYRVNRLVRLSMLPKLAGNAAIPSARLIYFDPSEGKYVTLQAAGKDVLVKVVSETAKAGGDVNLAPLIADPKAGARRSGPLPLPLFYGLLLWPFLVSILLAGGLGLYRSFILSPERRKMRRVQAAYHREIRLSHRTLDTRKAEQCQDHLFKALNALMHLKTGRNVSGLDRDALRKVLEESGLPTGEAGSLISILDRIEEARYAKEMTTRQELLNLYQGLKDLAGSRRHE